MLPAERGSATVRAVAWIGLLATVAVAAAAVTGLVAAKRGAESAADLAALAGATALQRGEAACTAAGRIASANHARVVRCSVRGATVTLDVRAPAPTVFHHHWTVHGRARAGPVG